MAELPEFVYLITASSEWPVSAIADDHPTTPRRVAAEVERRMQSGNCPTIDYIHVWRVPVRDAVEMKLVPEERIPASLREVAAGE